MLKNGNTREKLTRPKILDALWDSKKVPDFIVEWSGRLIQTAPPAEQVGDEILHFTWEYADLRAALHDGRVTNFPEMVVRTTAVYEKILAWFDRISSAGSQWSFSETRDTSVANSWNGINHHYSNTSILQAWNWVRCLCILLSRTQEMLMMRTSNASTLDRSTFSLERQHFCDQICHSIPFALGQGQGAITPMFSAFRCIMPLLIAGSVALEPHIQRGSKKGNTVTLPDGNSESKRQLYWIIGRLEYIGMDLGNKWAVGLAEILTLPSELVFDADTQWVTTFSQDILPD